jgi:Holliday junction resolvasome RuvABC endonuclease subunit
MKLIGIDFSILYPGFCVSDNFNSFHHFAVTNNKLTKKYDKYLDDINQQYKGVTIAKLGERPAKDKQYHINERNKLQNFDALTDLIIEELEKLVTSKDNIIAIEGISYGSSGNSLVDICQATGILKSKILNSLTDSTDKIFVFSPSSLKNALGCKGNASKTDVFKKFVQDPVIEDVKNCDLFKLLHNEMDSIFDPTKNKGKGQVESPFMDMIDSTLPIIKLYEILKNNP